MTLTEIKAQFVPGDKWHALREEPLAVVVGNLGTSTLPGKHRDEIRTAKRLATKDLVFTVTDDGKERDYYTPWPKASELVEARPGRIQFKINEGRVTVTLTKV